MKRATYTFILMLIVASVFAQTPQAICYQAVASDATGVSLVDQDITVRTSILLNNPNGAEQWIETHNITTDEFGLFTLDVGRGTPTGGSVGQFENIDWGNGTYFLKVELDIEGGTNFSFMGTNQILSVPYAIHAESANTANTAEHANTADTSLFANTAGHANTADTSLYANTAGHANTADNAEHANTSDTAIFANVSDTALISQISMQTLGDDDGDPTNELQTIGYQDNVLSISNGNEIPLDIRDEDSDPTNEIQTISYENNVLSISNGNEIALDIRDEDSDPTNEIQTLTFENNILTLSGSDEEVSTVDFDDMAFRGPGASIDFPQGIEGQHIVKIMGQYQVPTNKIFYITAGGPTIKMVGYGVNGVYEHSNTPNMPILPGGTIIKDCMCTGFLMSPIESIEAVIIDLSTESYTVPVDMVLFLKSGMIYNSTSYLNVNGVEMEFLRPNFTRATRTITLPAGTTIRKSNTVMGDLVMTGFLHHAFNQP